MPEHRRDRRDRHAIRKQERSRRVAHVVEAQVGRQSRSAELALEIPNEVADSPECQSGEIEAIMA
jgi:hypothetical protein